jgi:CO/xanthine dehydrogenase Mo-binding subunit
VAVGQSVVRKEAVDKVTGVAKYSADFVAPGILRARLVTSSEAHARLLAIESDEARAMTGVRAIVTGDQTNILCGEVLADRPPLARDKVRYHGEPLAVVVADTEAEAQAAAARIRVRYQPLPVVNGTAQALEAGAPLVHEALGAYTVAEPPCAPEAGTNVADRAKVRKGDMAAGEAAAEAWVEARLTAPQMDHAAMETRSAQVEILPDGRVLVSASTQAPFEVQRQLAHLFGLQEGQVVVEVPFVGGAFGGKAAVQLEVIAYLASRAVGGRPVRLTNTREEDIAGSPVGIGLDATVRLGATRTGRLTAGEMTYRMDGGAYTDSAPRMARAIASACTGPYRLDNVRSDVLCVYTNHVYATALRGFGYMPMTFAVERAMDKLADRLGLDPLELRLRNAIRAGDTTPTRYRLTESIIGDLSGCLTEAARLVDWQGGRRQEIDPRHVRGRGLAAIWKTSSSPQNAISAAVVQFNRDGSVNLSVGAVECGPGTKTTVAQMLADALGLPVERVHVHMDVRTSTDPEHWKTVASMATFMVGRAVLEAAQDAVSQLKSIAGIVLRCPPDDLAVGGGRVYLKDDPSTYRELGDLAHGYRYPDGDSIGGQIIGRGGFMVRHLTPLDAETGEGMAGPSWTVGAQAVEVELDPAELTYRLVRAVTVLDAGRVINPKGARGVVMGGMCQGLGFATRECLLYDGEGRVRNRQLRLYKLMRAGEQPEYRTAFLENPQVDGPFGARPLGEHGIIGMPAALANALSAASGFEIDDLPVTPEALWRYARSAEAARPPERAPVGARA